jgi:hypothetical protein
MMTTQTGSLSCYVQHPLAAPTSTETTVLQPYILISSLAHRQVHGHAPGDQVHVALSRGGQLAPAGGHLLDEADGLKVAQDVADVAAFGGGKGEGQSVRRPGRVVMMMVLLP